MFPAILTQWQLKPFPSDTAIAASVQIAIHAPLLLFRTALAQHLLNKTVGTAGKARHAASYTRNIGS